MKTETGTKMYPFNGEYRVASKQAVASPTNMNVLFIKAPNPINVGLGEVYQVEYYTLILRLYLILF